MFTRLFLEDDDPVAEKYFRFSLSAAFAAPGVSMELCPVQPPKRNGDIHENVLATLAAAKTHALQKPDAQYSIYLTAVSGLLVSAGRKAQVDYAPLIVLSGSRLIRASLEPLGDLSGSAAETFAFLCMEMQRLWPISDASRRERATAKWIADLAVEGLLNGIELIARKRVVIDRNKLD